MPYKKKIARGYVQAQIFLALVRGCEVRLQDYVNARTQYTGYIQSFLNLFNRMREAGYKVELEKGKRGGYWTATARIREK